MKGLQRRYATSHRQPQRTILRRYRTPGGQQWAELECGHTEPCSDLPMATALRCRECLPERVVRAPTTPGQAGG